MAEKADRGLAGAAEGESEQLPPEKETEKQPRLPPSHAALD